MEPFLKGLVSLSYATKSVSVFFVKFRTALKDIWRELPQQFVKSVKRIVKSVISIVKSVMSFVKSVKSIVKSVKCIVKSVERILKRVKSVKGVKRR